MSRSRRSTMRVGRGQRWWLGAAGVAALACSDGPGQPVAACGAGFGVALAVGQYVSIDPAADSGCAVFPANGSGSEAEYLLVPQLATGTPGQTSTFQLVGDTFSLTASLTPAGPLREGGSVSSPAAAFHSFLRRGDERRSWGFAPVESPRLAAPVAPGPPPAYGSARLFKVCARLDCSVFENVNATVRAVRTKVAIYVDNLAPAGGVDSTTLDSLARLFDDRLYPVDTAAFGRESDIDSNTVVLVLMTNVVNELVTETQCRQGGFVAGFFLGADIDPLFQTDPRSNKGELFYSIVADPQGTLESCAHSVTQVTRLVPITFVHEFQHMISYNQHVLERGGNGEALWLNEGLSHFAEELAGRTYASGSPEFSRFVIGNLFDAYEYLDSTRGHFLLPTAGIGSLAERGAQWLFVRYIVDRHSGGATPAVWNTFTRRLVETTQTGAANVAGVTGQPFIDVVTRWALANWVSDLSVSGFTPPPELRYDSWAFRATYASLHAQDDSVFAKPFPLVPTVSTGRGTDVTGTLRAGSGVYHRATQPAGGGPFATRFRGGNGALLNATFFPRLNVIRIR